MAQKTNMRSSDDGSSHFGFNGVNGTDGGCWRFQSGHQVTNGTNEIIEDLTKTLKELSILHDVSARQNFSSLHYRRQNERPCCVGMSTDD